MALFSQVIALRSALEVPSELSLPGAVAYMMKEMGLPTESDTGVEYSLPVKVQMLSKALEIPAQAFTAAATDSEMETLYPSSDEHGQTSSAATPSSSNSRTQKQTTVGSFFGAGVTKQYERGRLVGSTNAAQHERFTDAAGPNLLCFCGRTFTHAPALLVHQRFCARAALAEDHGLDAHTAGEEGERVSDKQVAGEEGEQVSDDPQPNAKRRKYDGGVKRSGLRQGQHRQPHTLMFKYQVALL